MISPCGHRIVVKPITFQELDEVYKRASAAGIQLLEADERAEQSAVDKGTVIKIGPTAFKDFGGEPWCKEGDIVVYARHAGKRVKDGETDYLVLNDEDLVCVLS